MFSQWVLPTGSLLLFVQNPGKQTRKLEEARGFILVGFETTRGEARRRLVKVMEGLVGAYY